MSLCSEFSLFTQAVCPRTYWLSTSFWKTFLIQRFTLNGKIHLWLLQIFTTKLILWPKMGLTYAIFIVNWIFGNILLKKKHMFCFSSLILNHW